MEPMSLYEQIRVLIPFALAACLGALIGLEREWRSKPAGLRTHILVTVSATLIICIGPPLVELFSAGFAQEIMRNEPLSMPQAIILGISFIGAGTVFKDPEQKHVMNLTTAGTLLFAGTVGMIVGAGLYYLAGAVTILVLAINITFGYIEGKLPKT